MIFLEIKINQKNRVFTIKRISKESIVDLLLWSMKTHTNALFSIKNDTKMVKKLGDRDIFENCGFCLKTFGFRDAFRDKTRKKFPVFGSRTLSLEWRHSIPKRNNMQNPSKTTKLHPLFLRHRKFHNFSGMSVDFQCF